MMIDKLYPYQKQSVADLLHGGKLADLSEVGTGKTITALGVMYESGKQSFLVVAPKSVVAQWQDKFAEWWSGVAVYRPESSAKKDRVKAIEGFRDSTTRPRALILTYEQVRSEVDLLSGLLFDIIYADEVHRIGNPTTQVSKCMRILASWRNFGATATPLRSSPLQAYGVFDWLNRGMFGNYYAFQNQYCDYFIPPNQEHKPIHKRQRWFKGYKNLDILAEQIAPLYVCNKMETAGVYLPPLVEQDIMFDLNPSEQKLYDQIRSEMLLDIESQQISKIENPTSLYSSVVKLGKLQELTDSMELLGENSESTKVKTLLEHLEDTLAGDNKAVVFTRFARMARILARELKMYNPALITGEVKDRAEQIAKFDNNDTCKVIIVTTAGNEGINLQRANLLYMVDVPMGSYGSLIQTIGRIKRIGQDKPMVVYYLMARDTVDERLKSLLLKKRDLAEQVFGSLADVRSMLV